MHFIQAERGGKLNHGKFTMEEASEGLATRQVTHEQTRARVLRST